MSVCKQNITLFRKETFQLRCHFCISGTKTNSQCFEKQQDRMQDLEVYFLIFLHSAPPRDPKWKPAPRRPTDSSMPGAFGLVSQVLLCNSWDKKNNLVRRSGPQCLSKYTCTFLCTKSMGQGNNIKKIIIIQDNGWFVPNYGFYMYDSITNSPPSFKVIGQWLLCY